MNTMWKQKENDLKLVYSLMEQTKLSRVTVNALLNRKLDTVNKINKFLKPSLSDVYRPTRMKDMTKAVTRIKKAIRESETIVIYGDYD